MAQQLDDARIPEKQHQLVGKREIYIGNSGNIMKDLQLITKKLQKTANPACCIGLMRKLVLKLPPKYCNLLDSGIVPIDAPGAESVDRTRHRHLVEALKGASSIFLFLSTAPVLQELQDALSNEQSGALKSLLVG